MTYSDQNKNRRIVFSVNNIIILLVNKNKFLYFLILFPAGNSILGISVAYIAISLIPALYKKTYVLTMSAKPQTGKVLYVCK